MEGPIRFEYTIIGLRIIDLGDHGVALDPDPPRVPGPNERKRPIACNGKRGFRR